METNEPGAADYNIEWNQRWWTRVQSMHVIRSKLPSDIIHIHYLFTANVNLRFESNGLFVNFACVSHIQADVEMREYMYCYRFSGPHIYLVITYFYHFNYIISILLCPKDVEAVGLPYQSQMLLK